MELVILIAIAIFAIVYNKSQTSSVADTTKYIKDNCMDTSYVSKYKKLGDSTNFFFKKTIYKVKK